MLSTYFNIALRRALRLVEGGQGLQRAGRFPALVCSLFLMFMLASCTNNFKYNIGHMVFDEDIAKINTTQTKDDIIRIIGTPTVIGVGPDGNDWYYIYEFRTATAFFRPKIVERRIVHIAFNNNIVSAVQVMDGDRGVDLDYDKEAESSGFEDDRSLLRKIFTGSSFSL